MTQTLYVPAASPLSRAINAIGGVVANRVFAVFRALKHRHDAQMLAGLDERMLKDIGLTRSDLRDAYAEPIWRDPTAVLVERAGERRTHRRRIAFGLQATVLSAPSIAPEHDGRNVPPTNRPARYAI
jgi:uncharacterized protein YjiS (DUF1127 family)